MGISDRDYARPQGRGGTPTGFGGRPDGFSLKGWSVNAWLIAICVGVFVVDQFLPRVMTPIQAVPVYQAASSGPSSRLMPLPEDGEVEHLDRGSIRIPGIADILDGKVPIWLPERDGAFGPRLLPKGSMAVSLPPVFMVQAWRQVDGASKPAMGTATVRDEAGNTRKGDVLLLEQIRITGPLWSFGYFSTSRALLTLDAYVGLRGFEFWRFITFQFLHADLGHLLFNMIGLYFFGALVEQYLGSKRYLAFYLLCGMMGAAAYLILNFAGWSMFQLTGRDLPVLLVNDPGTPLVGASAGVFGVVMASAFLVPNARVLLFFIIPMRLATLAYGLVIVALVSVTFGTTNAGGEAAHIGGAVAGYWLIRRPHLLHGFFDFLGRYDPTSRSGAAYRAGRLTSTGAVADAEVDRILAKIHADGLQSLTRKEKDQLRKASRR